MRRVLAFTAVWAGGALYAAGCGTNPVGVDDCRRIETARCRAAEGCDVGLASSSNEATCERFARDHCLHGLSTDPPRASQVDLCVATIDAAGACASKKGGGASPAASCPGVGDVVESNGVAVTVCGLIEAPDLATSCAFLDIPRSAPTSTSTAPKDAAPD
jgi:hypothetical protein